MKGIVYMQKTVLITGANKGIGFATALEYLSKNYNVIISGRSKEKIEAAKIKINNPRCECITWDISNISTNDEVLKTAHSFFGDIHIFVNNAGIVLDEDTRGSFLDRTESLWDTTMSTNLKGLYFALQAEARYMAERSIKGHIVNVCSEMSFRDHASLYSISKWGARCITAGLAKELASLGIVLNGVAPGQTATEILHQKEGEFVKNSSPRGFRAMPSEVAREIVFLSENDNMIGSILRSDGGNTLR